MRILVIRTSAMGDVALAAPVIMLVKSQYPDSEIVILTRIPFNTFFSEIQGVNTFIADFKGRHKGLRGIIRLCKEIKSTGRFDYVIDIHNVLRSILIRSFLRFSGAKVTFIKKDRKEKNAIISGKSKTKLKHTVDRYRETFERAGLNAGEMSFKRIPVSQAAERKAEEVIGSFSGLTIGVAPYAKHTLKMWPDEFMISLLGLISEKNKSRFFLFGGKEEGEKLEKLQLRIAASENLCGKLKLDEELAVMSRLDFMIAMDSSNMHMAALSGTKVISIWGGTDPLTGFGAWMQPDEFSIKIPYEDLICRPCTVYGKGVCRRGDLACMSWLTPEIVFEKIKSTGVLKQAE